MARKIDFNVSTAELEKADSSPSSEGKASRHPLLALQRTMKQSSALRAVSESLDGYNEKVKHAAEIEHLLTAGQTIVDLDPDLVDASFVRDRMEATEEQNAAFREMIREHGQAVPILVRPHPGDPNRFEVAFGHRRLRAARELGIKVRAVVRNLTDDQLVIAQGQENSGRTDLTFIERARFAAQLEERKFPRETIQSALGVDKTVLSRLISIAIHIPAPLIDAIGPAPSFGRVRWQEMKELLDQGENRLRAQQVVTAASFANLSSDSRFETLYNKLRPKTARSRKEAWSANDGTRAAYILRSGRKLSLTFDERATPRFGDFVMEKLQGLYDEYKALSDKKN